MALHAQNRTVRAKNRWRTGLWLGLAALLALPFAAMQVTDEVAWDAADFALFGAMLVAVGLAFEITFRTTTSKSRRVATGAAIIAVFLLLWAQAAVGVITI